MIDVLILGLVAFVVLFYLYGSSVRADEALEAIREARRMALAGRIEEAEAQRAYARRLKNWSWLWPIRSRPRSTDD